MKKNHLFYSKARPLSLLGLGLLCSSPNLIASNLKSKLSYFHVEQQQISGSVKNEKGDPLAGATITVKGSTIQAATDANGSFSIRAKQGDFLVINYQGYARQEVAVGSGTIAVTMISNTESLEEVVIVGYGKQKKGNLTGAVAAVNSEQLKNISPSNLSNTLAGRAAGVNVTNTSGMAGASSSLRIRGAAVEPLYVIDGVVRDKAAFDALEANEVDQMSFLKDAGTAAVYGTRAGNGVVLVTTKKGTAQAPVFNVQSNYSFSAPTQTLLANLTTATDELIYQNRVSQFRWEQGKKSEPWVAPNGQREFDYFKDKNYNTNDVIWRNPFSHRQSIAVNGGGDKITYYALLSYRKENGSYKSLDHEKFNLRSNISAKISDAFSMDFNISANQTNSNRFFWPFSTSASDDDFDVSDFYRVTFNWPKMYPFYLTADGTPSNTPTAYPVQTPMGSWQAWNVIDQVIGDRYIDRKVRQVNPIMTLNLKLDKLLEGLSTKLVGSYVAEDYMRKRYMSFQKNYTFTSLNPDGNRFIPAPPSEDRTNVFTFSQAQPFMDYNPQRKWQYQVDWFLNYNRKFGKHTVDGLVVYEQFKSGNTNITSRAENPIIPLDQMYIYPTDRSMRSTDAFELMDARRGVIGRANYNYADKYIAEFSFRYDGSPLFPNDKRWGFFPSMSLGWRMSDENFFSSIKNTVSDLKLRASYGSSGNFVDVEGYSILPYSYMEKYSSIITSRTGSRTPVPGYIFGDSYYTGVTYLDNPTTNLTWTKSKSYNVGIDFGFVHNKLTGSLDGFIRKESDILGTRGIKVPDNYGRGLAPENYAARSFRGGELSLNWNDRVGEVSYGLNANMGYAKDRWDIFDEEPSYAAGGRENFRSKVGRPENRIIGLEASGLVRTQAEADALKGKGFKTYGRDPYPGMILYKDIRGQNYSDQPDGIIDDNDMQLLSENNTPRINYGFGFNASWKGFYVSALFQGVLAYDRVISNQEGAGMRQHGDTFRPYYPIWTSDVWTPDNTDAKYPRPVGYNWQESGAASSTFWIRNGAYMRLRDLNISYTLPQAMMEKIKMKSVNVFLNGTNLFVFSPMKEFHDPEQKMYDSYPVMKTFTLGLDVKFNRFLMMKKIFYPLVALLLTTASCKNVLDIEDLNSVNEDKVWNDPNLVNAYLANLYTLFGNWNSGADNNSQQLAGINFPLNAVTVNNTVYKAWDYTTMRKINTAIQKVSGSTGLNDATKKSILGQALFMRAYMYFNMVKHHGGVPYITKPQDLEDDELKVPRNSTKECFDLIVKDLDEALTYLPMTIAKGAADYGRIDGNFALAFKAKVLLYKASPQFNPSNPYGNAYWAEANAVNKKAYEQLKTQGYNLTADYYNIALVEKGPEVVFAVINSYPNKVANWDNGVRPGSESRGTASAVPTWDFVKEFPMKDGKLYTDPTSKYHKTDEQFLQSYWENRDPRFDKSIVWNGKVYEVSGKTGKRQYTSLGIADALDNFGENPKAGTTSSNRDRYTGFFILKNSKLSLRQTQVETQYDVDFVLMRYAEVMLNYAETANETGDLATATSLLKQIRMRAGIEPGGDNSYGIVAGNKSDMREALLAERNIEFCFEGHRFWDLRRLRRLAVLNNKTKQGVEAIAINANGTDMDLKAAADLAKNYQLKENQFKYNVLQVPSTGNKVNLVPDTYYFFPIAQSVIDKNPNIKQNKDWGGEFNPTIE